MGLALRPLTLWLIAISGLVAISDAQEPAETKRKGPRGPVWTTIVCDDWAATRVEANPDVMLWRLPDGRVNYRLKGPEEHVVRGMCFAPDGSELCVTYPGYVRFWNLTKPGEYKQKEWAAVISDYSADGKFLVSSAAAKVEVFERTNLEKPVATFDLKDDFATGLARFSPDGKSIVAAVGLRLKKDEQEYDLRQFSISKEFEVRSKPFPSRWALWALETISKDRYLVASMVTCYVWNPRSNKLEKISREKEGVFPLATEPKSKLITFATDSDEIVFLDGNTLKRRMPRASEKEWPIWSVAASSKHGVLVVGYGNPFAPGKQNDGYVGFRKEPSLKEAK